MQAKKRCSVQTLTSTEGPSDPKAGATSEAWVFSAAQRQMGRPDAGQHGDEQGACGQKGRAQLRTGSEPLLCVCVCVCVCVCAKELFKPQ